MKSIPVGISFYLVIYIGTYRREYRFDDQFSLIFFLNNKFNMDLHLNYNKDNHNNNNFHKKKNKI